MKKWFIYWISKIWCIYFCIY